jgi:DNA-binding PadR family transcriptional regulator
MAMTISSALIDLVPIGEENAATGLLLWKQLGMWSPTSIKHTLNDMAEAGLIERKRVQRGAGDISFYFRPSISGSSSGE